MRCASDPTLTLRDIGHDAAATREQNASLVLAKLPGTTRTLAVDTGLETIAVAAAVLLLTARKQARLTDPTVYPFTYAKV